MNVLPLHKKSLNNRLIIMGHFLFFVFWARYFIELYSNMFRGNSLISRWQSGFLQWFSIVTQLLEMYHQFYNAINEGKDVKIVYLDLSKAFDLVWHKGLLFKLNKFGIGCNLLKWFSDYLSNHFQRVIINGRCLVKSYCGGSSWLCIGSIAFSCICQWYYLSH